MKVIQLQQQLAKSAASANNEADGKRMHALEEAMARTMAQNDALKAQILAMTRGADNSRR